MKYLDNKLCTIFPDIYFICFPPSIVQLSYHYNMKYLHSIKIKIVKQYFFFCRMQLFFVDLNEEMYNCMIKCTL